MSDRDVRLPALESLAAAASAEIGACKRNAPSNPKFDVRVCTSGCAATKTCAALDHLLTLEERRQ